MPIIVYVDDDADRNYAFFQQAIHKISNHVILHYTECGEDCYQLLDNILPEYIFIGTSQNGPGAIEMLQKIRMEPRLKHIPVIMYSSLTELADQAQQFGATYFLRKQDSYENTEKQLNDLFKNSVAVHKKLPREQFMMN